MTPAILIYSNLFCKERGWLFSVRNHAVGDRRFSFKANDQCVLYFFIFIFYSHSSPVFLAEKYPKLKAASVERRRKETTF